MRLLLDLANAAGLRAGIDAMFRSDKLNVTENRAVLYVTLRAPAGATIRWDSAIELKSWRKACQAVGVGQMVMDARKIRKVWLSHRKRRANAHFREETRGSSRRCIVRV
jgi:glucose-6-phosphate isomerase